MEETPFGTRYMVEGPLLTPDGRNTLDTGCVVCGERRDNSTPGDRLSCRAWDKIRGKCDDSRIGYGCLDERSHRVWVEGGRYWHRCSGACGWCGL
ncbi:MAG: hypothetical protein ACUVXI_18985 [bacterium]